MLTKEKKNSGESEIYIKNKINLQLSFITLLASLIVIDAFTNIYQIYACQLIFFFKNSGEKYVTLILYLNFF